MRRRRDEGMTMISAVLVLALLGGAVAATLEWGEKRTAEAVAEIEMELDELRQEIAARATVVERTDTAELQALGNELAELRGTLKAEVKAKLDCQAGRLIDDIAKVQSALQAARAPARTVSTRPAPPPRPARRAEPRVRAVSGPYVALVGDNIRVTGKVYNFGDGGAYPVRIRLEVMEDGRPVGSRVVLIRLSPGGEATFDEEIRHRPRDGSRYTASLNIG